MKDEVISSLHTSVSTLVNKIREFAISFDEANLFLLVKSDTVAKPPPPTLPAEVAEITAFEILGMLFVVGAIDPFDITL